MKSRSRAKELARAYGQQNEAATLNQIRLEDAWMAGWTAGTNGKPDPEFEQCEFCAEPATYMVQCSDDATYRRYACGRHGRKVERLVDLDLGLRMRKHTISSTPFKRED